MPPNLSNRFITVSAVITETDKIRLKNTLGRFSSFFDIADDRTVLEQRLVLPSNGEYEVALPSVGNRLVVVRSDRSIEAVVEFPGDPSDVEVVMDIDGLLVLSTPVVAMTLRNPVVEGVQSANLSVIVF